MLLGTGSQWHKGEAVRPSMLRTIRILAAILVPTALAIPAAQASTFGALKAYENDDYKDLVGEASGGAHYYEAGKTGNFPTIVERIRFRDVDADGDGAHGVAQHVPYEHVCNPQRICYWTWTGIREDQTNRYGTADGWRISYMREWEPDASHWKTRPKACVDQNNEPDACGEGTFQQP